MSRIFLKAEQVYKAVRELYAKGGYICLSQVRNGTGFEKRQVRTADMLAVSTWPSRGLFTEGIEIKVSVNDLSREIANPAKAEEIAQYCAFWWIAGPEGIADNITLPENWGLISVNEKLKAKVAVQAKRLTPKPMDELFVCACLRAFAEHHVPASEVEDRVAAGLAEAVKRAYDQRTRRLEDLEKTVAEFKEHSGIDLLSERGHHRYDLADIGWAVSALSRLRGLSQYHLKHTREALESGIGVVDVALRTLNGIAPPEDAAK